MHRGMSTDHCDSREGIAKMSEHEQLFVRQHARSPFAPSPAQRSFLSLIMSELLYHCRMSSHLVEDGGAQAVVEEKADAKVAVDDDWPDVEQDADGWHDQEDGHQDGCQSHAHGQGRVHGPEPPSHTVYVYAPMVPHEPHLEAAMGMALLGRIDV